MRSRLVILIALLLALSQGLKLSGNAVAGGSVSGRRLQDAPSDDEIDGSATSSSWKISKDDSTSSTANNDANMDGGATSYSYSYSSEPTSYSWSSGGASVEGSGESGAW